MLFSLTGVALGHRKRLINIEPYFALAIIYLMALSLFAQFTPFISFSGMRHQLPGWLILSLIVTLGLLSLYRFRRWLAIILLLWVVAGATFQITGDWKYYTAGRIYAFDEPPWHVLSRALARKDTRGPVIGFRLSLDRISYSNHVGYSLLEHLFERANIDLRVVDELAALDEFVRDDVIRTPEFWVLYQTDDTNAKEAAEILAIASAWQYAACETRKFGINTVLERYRWQTLGCETDLESASDQNELIDYKYYAMRVDSAGSRIFIVDEWTARSDGSLDSYNMSFQLISQDWDNVTQLDIPMVYEGMLRQLSIDVGEVPRGSYRLMAVVYDKFSGRRFAWRAGDADLPGFLPLADVVLE